MNDNPTNADEQYELGKKYCNGDGVPKDPEKANYWFTKAAEQGKAEAQSILAANYYIGDIVPRDLEKANYWSTKAAEQGFVEPITQEEADLLLAALDAGNSVNSSENIRRIDEN